MDKDIFKNARGHSVEYVGNVGGTDVSTILWKGNNSIMWF